MAVATAGQSLLLKRAAASRLSGEWNDDDFDVLADGVVVGRIFKADAAPARTPWMWTMPAGRRMAMRRRARLQWRRSPRPGGGDSLGAGRSELFVASPPVDKTSVNH